ncbi:HTH domain-containing protein, Cro/C1-type [Desulfonema limicola]|uniref:HTH domain-containing protein, Cro/C1-type n=1 Tax=Desulfonema limicola TaxID=45656 RepID=A0A975GHE5_9BACT|nr:helix-turn-helix domain-containing protein [Desulfonema limicola]QTA81224.1 HTH domain-containing protein, Cro/C1-type [Desulfonema limicola]
MRKEKRSSKVKDALGSLTQDLIDAGLGSPFTEKELNYYGINIPEIKNISPKKIKVIREKAQFSQSVFARLLNVSTASIKQWEQGTRNPNGATKVLLDLLDRYPHILDYRINKSKRKNYI